jgi:hypothetical protein
LIAFAIAGCSSSQQLTEGGNPKNLRISEMIKQRIRAKLLIGISHGGGWGAGVTNATPVTIACAA